MAIDPELLKKQTDAAQPATEVPQTNYITNTNATYRIGSSGDGVKELQKALISKNYLAAGGDDGIYGKNTAAAVRQYQKDNGLSVDGIAGTKTLTALAGGSTSATGGTTGNSATQNANGFTPSEMVNQAYALLQQQQANKPGAYSPVWQEKADAYLEQYQNRDPFTYDVNKDAMYQMYRDMYVQQGQMAMMDTMGQVAAMSGGYGNSYGQAAGQQAYHQYLNQLNAMVPELAQMAQDRYDREGQRMMEMYGIYQDRENQEYARHQDNMDRWYQEVARLQGDYDSQWARDYQLYRDSVADTQWQKQYDLQKKSASRSSSSSSKTPTHTYKTLEAGSTAYNTIANAIAKANSLDNLQDVTEKYIALGYDPQEIYGMAKTKINQLSSLFGAAGELY
jgi:peptidoglycan hydrolase-like protein with peptidoglycan-binding domain